MSYFQSPDSRIHWLDDDSFSNLLPVGSVRITESQATAIKAAIIAASIVPASLKIQAQTALDKSDVTLLRCVEAGVAIPSEWIVYRKTLRAIVVSGNGILPTTPPYPTGT